MKRWLSIVVTIFFLLLLAKKFSDVGVERILQSLRQVNVFYFITGVSLMVLSAFFQACRWSVILLPLGRFSPFQTFSSVTIGHWFNAVLPARIGEVARPFHFSKKHNLPFITMLATTIIERIFDLLFVFALAVLSLLFVWADVDAKYILTLMVLYMMVLISLFVFVMKKGTIFTWINRIHLPWRNNIQTLLLRFYEGIRLVNNAGQLVRVIFFTAAVWVVNICSYWLLLKSCGLPDMLQKIGTGVAVTLVGAVTHAIPSTASGLGVINYGVVVALEQYARLKNFDITAFGNSIVVASIVIYVAALIPDILIGGFFYWKDRELFVGFEKEKES